MADIYQEEFSVLSDLINKTEVRNIKVRCFWEGLKYSELKYRERIQITISRFYISQQSVESIISKKRKNNVI